MTYQGDQIGEGLNPAKIQTLLRNSRYTIIIPKEGGKSKHIDHAGRVYGRLTVVSLAGIDVRDSCAVWVCRCKCGRYHLGKAKYLASGTLRSCGCTRPVKVEKPRGPRGKYYKAKVGSACQFWPDVVPAQPVTALYGLIVLQPVARKMVKNWNWYEWHYLCQCKICGDEIITPNLRRKDCGCVRKGKIAAAEIKRNAPPPKKFDRLSTCTRVDLFGKLRNICSFYNECQEERIKIDGHAAKKVSTRYAESGGMCFVPSTNEDLQYYRRISI